MAMVRGLAAFLELARLEEKLPEASDFCQQIGAIEVREVLEDEELCQELAEQIQLKPLELKRFKSLAAEVCADPSFQLTDPTPTQEASRPSKFVAPPTKEVAEPSPLPNRERQETNRRLFAANSWAKPSRGKGRGTGVATGHYFDQGKASPGGPGGAEEMGGRNHYFRHVEEPPMPRAAANPYFGSLASEARCACGSSNVGRHMCFDCGRERQPNEESPRQDGRGDRSKGGRDQADGSSRTRFCIHCGAPQLPAAKFCGECGERCLDPRSEPETSGPRRGGYAERPACAAPRAAGAPAAPKHDEEVESYQDFKAQLKKDVLNAPVTERGVGAYIRSLDGELWGRVVCDQGRSWQLASGRSAKKENEGKVWVFENPSDTKTKAPKAVPEVTRQSSILDDLAEKRRHEEEALHAKREAARQRRREGDQRSTERRVDPDDNQMYSWEELRTRYRGMFSDSELLEYWNKDCKVVPSAGASGPPKGSSRSSERRKDPDDGKVYSFDELCRKYRGAFSVAEIEEYWLEECG